MMQLTKMKRQKKTQTSKKRRQRQQPKRMNILKKSKHLRRWFLRNPWLRPLIVFNYAAITLQKLFRGFLVRRKKFFNKGVIKINTKARRTQSQLDKYLNFVESCKSKTTKRKVFSYHIMHSLPFPITFQFVFFASLPGWLADILHGVQCASRPRGACDPTC